MMDMMKTDLTIQTMCQSIVDQVAAIQITEGISLSPLVLWCTSKHWAESPGFFWEDTSHSLSGVK